MVAAVFHEAASLPLQQAGEGRDEGIRTTSIGGESALVTPNVYHAVTVKEELKPPRDLSFI